MVSIESDPAIAALRASGPLPALREKLMLFGQFVAGTWGMDIRFFNETGKEVFHGPGGWSFTWILDGRAVQDVLTYADTTDPTKTAADERRTGTTLRYYHAELDAWRMVWVGATSGTFLNLTARPEGIDMDGSFLRWSFTEIAPDSFRWTGQTSRDGKTWRVEQEMLGRRRAAAPSGGIPRPNPAI
jgi:hypothetical protein